MASPTRIPGDLNVAGGITCQRLTPPAGSVYDPHIADGAAGVYISAQKVRHQVTLDYDQAPGGNVAAATKLLHIFHGATGTIVSVRAALVGVIPSGDRTATLDVQKSTAGGAFATVLTATLTLDSANVIRVPEAATLLTNGAEDLVADDLLQIVVTVAGSAGTNPQGLLVTLVIDEKDPE